MFDYITIWIIARNEEKTLPITLSYLFEQSYPIKEYCEIIIADGDSTDRTKEVAEETLQQSWISHQVLNERDYKDKQWVWYGHSRWRNVILMNADKRSTYIAWIDGDCRADKDRLMNLRTIIKNNADEKIAGAWGTRFIETQWKDISIKELVLNYYFTSNIISLGNPAFTPKVNITTIPSVAWYNSIFKKEIFKHYQYNSIFPFNTDDLEMNFRLIKDGYKFLYAKDAIIYHRGEQTISWFLKQMKNYGKGVAYTMRLHHTPFVRLYAWIALWYIWYTVLLTIFVYLSMYYWYSIIIPVIPYILLWLVWCCVFIENYRKTSSLTSIIVIPTLFAHLRYYGWWVVQGLLEPKKVPWKQ